MNTNRAHHLETYYQILHHDGVVHSKNFRTREDAEAALIANAFRYHDPAKSRVVERHGRASKGRPGNIS